VVQPPASERDNRAGKGGRIWDISVTVAREIVRNIVTQLGRAIGFVVRLDAADRFLVFDADDITAHHPKEPEVEIRACDNGDILHARGDVGQKIAHLDDFLPGKRLDPERLKLLEEVARNVVDYEMDVLPYTKELARKALGK